MKHFFYLASHIINYSRHSGSLFIATLMIMITLDGQSQKQCTNPPTLNLRSTSGTTCYIAPITVTDNIFGGSATQVTISSNGTGSINPPSAFASPFTFTYSPNTGDIGRVVTITVTTNNPLRSPCKAAKETYTLTVLSNLPAPTIDSISQTTCTQSTGGVHLSGLPSTGWTVTTNPAGTTIEGTGTTTTINMLPPGTYTFTVTVASGCPSSSSAAAVINNQPVSPPPPLPGSVTAPTCTTLSGSVVLANLPSPGTWILTRYPGTVQSTGTGSSVVISGLPPGLFNFAVTNAAGCTSELSATVTIPDLPPVPPAPVIGTVVQPTYNVPTGSVTLTGLPSPGAWTIIRSPGDVITTGTGTSITISELRAGAYTFKVMNSAGCTSNGSNPVELTQPVRPELVITDPPAVCYPATVDLTAPEITAGSTVGLTFTYWIDSDAKTEFKTPHTAWNGKYYIKGTTASGYFDIKPVSVIVQQPTVAKAGPDQTLAFKTSTTLSADIGAEETGTWFADSGNVVFSNYTDPHTSVSDLSVGKNMLYWIVTNNVCPADTGKVTILVGGLLIPTLITPNGDSKNEYFVIEGIESIGNSELIIFDRRGKMLFKAKIMTINGTGSITIATRCANDTYFYMLKSANGRSFSGYIMIRR